MEQAQGRTKLAILGELLPEIKQVKQLPFSLGVDGNLDAKFVFDV
jgi:hypothetical protein